MSNLSNAGSNSVPGQKSIMANICSKHQHYDPDCKLCNTHPRDMLNHAGEMIFPDWDEKRREAIEAGLITCEKCSFEYYGTTNCCPLCGHPYGAKDDATETGKAS